MNNKKFQDRLQIQELEHPVKVFEHYIRGRNNDQRFEVLMAPNIGKIQMNFQKVKDGQQIGQVAKIWLNGDRFLGVMERLFHKENLHPGSRDVGGRTVPIYWDAGYMGGTVAGNIQFRSLKIGEPANPKYMYTISAYVCEGVQHEGGTITPKAGATKNGGNIPLTEDEFVEMYHAIKKHWYGYAAAQWCRIAVHDELISVLSEYDRYRTQATSVTQQPVSQPASQRVQSTSQVQQPVAQQPTVQTAPASEAPVQPVQPAQPAPQPASQPEPLPANPSEALSDDDLPF